MPEPHDHSGLLGVMASEAAFEQGDDWLDAVISQIADNRALLAEALTRELPEIKWTPRKPPTWPGLTARTSASVTTPPSPFCTTAASP